MFLKQNKEKNSEEAWHDCRAFSITSTPHNTLASK